MKYLRYIGSSVVALYILVSSVLVAQETSTIGEERAFEYVAPWPPWLTIVVLVAAAVLVYGLYLREATSWPAWTKWLLATIRFGLICLVLWMMYGFTERPFRTDLPDLLVFVDDSPSMQTVDAIQNERLKSQIADETASLDLPDTSRLSQAKSVLLRNDAQLLRFLQSNYQVKLLGLESELEQQPESDLESKIRTIQPTGEQSRLGASLRRGLQQRRGRPVASVLFLSDGITTDGPLLSEVAREAKQREIPLHIVGLGSRLPARDIQLSDLLVNDVVFVGDLVTFDFKLSASGYANQTVEVLLRRKDGTGEPVRKSVELTAEQDSKSARLVFKATEKGEFDFVIEVPPREGEVSDENNRLTARVEVRDEKTRVLLVQSYPNFEFHYLKTLLQRASESSLDGNGSVELSVLLQDADPQFADIDSSALRNFPSREELFKYDVCIFGDVNPGFLSSQSLQDLRDFVVERGRGLIGVAGPRYFPAAYAGTPLAEIIPFELRNALAPPADLPIDTGYRPRLTSLGQRMPAMQLSSDPTENASLWTELPELYWLLEVDALKMGTRTLAEHPVRTGTSDQPFPVVTLSYAGAGKVLFHCTDDSWRWRIGRGDEFFGRYWQQSIRYLSRFKLGEGRDVELTSDRETYERGETVRLRSRFFDDRVAPSEDEGVVVELEQAGSRRQQVVLNRDPTQRGSFSGDIGSLRTGKYHAWISEPAFEVAAPSVDFEITAPDTELTRLQIDTAEMEKAAEVSSGEYYSYQSAQTLSNRLPIGKQVRIETLAPEPMWNSWPVALVFVVLLVTEWLLRRQFGMV